MTFLGPYLVACTLLAVAGAGKAIRPVETTRALAPVLRGVPVAVLGPALRVMALGEAALGVAAAVLPDRPLAGAVAASYLAFAAFVVYVRVRHGSLASCGCFSTPDTPATWVHVAVNGALAAAAGAVSASGSPHQIFSLLAAQPLAGVPLLVASGAGAWLVFLTLVGLARLHAVRRSLGPVATGTSGTSR